MKLLTVGAAALLSISPIAVAEPGEPESGNVTIIEGDRVDIYEHRGKQGRSRVDVAPKQTMPYSFVGSEADDEDAASRPAGDAPNAPNQMWSIKKW